MLVYGRDDKSAPAEEGDALFRIMLSAQVPADWALMDVADSFSGSDGGHVALPAVGGEAERPGETGGQVNRLALVLLAASAAALAVPLFSPVRAEPAADRQFPDSHLGIYKGTCRSVSPDGKKMEFPMRLELAADRSRLSWSFTIVYGEGERAQVRDYRLLGVDDAPGRFRIDEKNGIVLDATLVGDTLHSTFSVQGNLIHARYRFVDGAVEFALDSFAEGGETGGKDGAPLVKGFVLQAAQQARLMKGE